VTVPDPLFFEFFELDGVLYAKNEQNGSGAVWKNQYLGLVVKYEGTIFGFRMGRGYFSSEDLSGNWPGQVSLTFPNTDPKSATGFQMYHSCDLRPRFFLRRKRSSFGHWKAVVVRYEVVVSKVFLVIVVGGR